MTANTKRKTTTIVAPKSTPAKVEVISKASGVRIVSKASGVEVVKKVPTAKPVKLEDVAKQLKTMEPESPTNLRGFQFQYDAKTARAAGYRVRSRDVKVTCAEGGFIILNQGVKNIMKYMLQLRATPKLKMSSDASITKQLDERSKVLSRVANASLPGETRLRLIHVVQSATYGTMTVKLASIDDVKKTMTIQTIEVAIGAMESLNGFVRDYWKITRNRGITSDQLRDRIFAL